VNGACGVQGGKKNFKIMKAGVRKVNEVVGKMGTEDGGRRM
jgi:hypothetical protein